MSATSRCLAVLAAAALAGFALAGPAGAATTTAPTTTTAAPTTSTTTAAGQVLRSDFEDGTVQGWQPLGRTALSVVTDSTGHHRLRVSGVTAPGQGATFNVSPAALTDGTGYTARATGFGTAAQPPGQFRLQAVSSVRETPITNTIGPDGPGDGWLETDFTWAATAPSLQLQVVAAGACPGQALPSSFEVDNIALRQGFFSGHIQYGCPPTTTTTTTTTAGSGCAATYHVESWWAGGYQATVTVRAASALNGWVVGWTLPAGDSIVTAWNAVVRTSGSQVTATDAGYNGRLAAGATTTFGLVARSGTTPGVPALSCRPR